MFSSGFAPIADPRARVLVLGTLPGQVSLLRQQYYAQPQNVFWKIMGALVGAGPELEYGPRIQRLKEHGIATMKIEARWLTIKPAWSLQERRTQPKLFKSPLLEAAQIRDLYSELMALDV